MTIDETVWWGVPDELALTDDPGSVRLARRFVAEHVPPGGLRDDAELVASELLANAFQHAIPPVVVRVLGSDSRVRIEVADGSSRVPVRALANENTMTGRGLALVESLSAAWGFRPGESGGKWVWAELSVGQPNREIDTPIDIDTMLAAWPDDDWLGPRRYRVQLGDVPTNLLLSAKAHVDNLVREFSLAIAGAESTGVAVPPHLSGLIDTVVHGFEDARIAIKQQALAAAERGEDRTALTLQLPLSAANAGEAYLDALDEADTYARAARVLTLETPPQHRVFRRWYVQAVVEQLRSMAGGEVPPPVPTFEQRLLDEIEQLAFAQRLSDRAARLQRLTAALARARSPEDVAVVVVSEGVAALGASGGSLLISDSDGHLSVPWAVGYGAELIDQLRAESFDAPLPAVTALRTGAAVWLESRQERDALFPQLRGLEPGTIAMCAVPLITTAGPLGALRFSFNQPRLFDERERGFVEALAAQTAHALERAQLDAAEREARAAAERSAIRLTGLAGVTAKLGAANDDRTIADAVVNEAANVLGATIATLFVLQGNMLRAVALRGVQPGNEARWARYPLDADVPAAEAVRTAQLIAIAGTQAIEQRWPTLAGRLAEDCSLVSLPLYIEGLPTGVISLVFPGQRLPDTHETMFLTALADTCAQALHRLEITAEADQAAARLQFLADASAELAGSLDYRMTLSRLARLAVPTLADWCAIEMLDEAGVLRTLVCEHVDPEKVAMAIDLQARYPANMDAPIGSPNVVRTGRSELISEVTDEMLVAGTQDADHLRLARELQLRSALVVPLTARDRVLGALTLVYAESDRRYTGADLPFAEDLAQRAAAAIVNSQLFSETRDIAIRLQRALLPEVVPTVPGWDISAHYSPAGEHAEVGGDWYDVIPLHGNRFVAVVGDVMGRGVAAAAAMAQMRSAIRGFVTVDPAPEFVLSTLDGMFDELDMTQLVTLLYLFVDARSGTAQLASAGHLPPWLLATGERSGPITLPIGLPFGVAQGDRQATTHQIEWGDSLLVYTDGLIERREHDIEIADLVRVAEVTAGHSAATVLERITHAAGVSVEHDDDVTLLVLRRTESL